MYALLRLCCFLVLLLSCIVNIIFLLSQNPYRIAICQTICQKLFQFSSFLRIPSLPIIRKRNRRGNKTSSVLIGTILKTRQTLLLTLFALIQFFQNILFLLASENAYFLILYIYRHQLHCFSIKSGSYKFL